MYSGVRARSNGCLRLTSCRDTSRATAATAVALAGAVGWNDKNPSDDAYASLGGQQSLFGRATLSPKRSKENALSMNAN